MTLCPNCFGSTRLLSMQVNRRRIAYEACPDCDATGIITGRVNRAYEKAWGESISETSEPTAPTILPIPDIPVGAET